MNTSSINLELGRSSSFGVTAKPIGPTCNLRCRYCYYLGTDRLYPGKKNFRMDARVLETFIREYINAQEGPEIQFLWQGGEPTLLGVPFFRKVVELQQHYCPTGKTILNSLQTNGTLLDECWAAFLRDNDFLVGLSIDGPQRLHDRYRVTRKGEPTFHIARKALRLMSTQNVEFNTLTVVHRGNVHRGREVYRFLKGEGVRFMQFIPLVERSANNGSLNDVPADETSASTVTPWSVPPRAFGDFMCAVFDEWICQDVGSIFVQLFDIHLALWAGMPSALCVYADTCGQGLAMEHNGDIYACDHYVEPNYYLGNIQESSIDSFAHSPRQKRFGQDKRNTLPQYCLECEFKFACNGGCPKHRVARTPDGEVGLNYLCPSYKRYFNHVAPHMREMTDLLAVGLPPALTSRMRHREESLRRPKPATTLGRNAPCPCGSGRKYKKCCGA